MFVSRGKVILSAMVAIGLGAVVIYYIQNQRPDVSPVGITYERIERLATFIANRKSKADHTAICPDPGDMSITEDMRMDGWGQSMTVNLQTACQKGGCLYEIISVGKDGQIETLDDDLARFVVGDCSDENLSKSQLFGLNLNLTGGLIRGAKVSNTRIQAFYASHADLRRVDFHGANLSCWLPTVCTSLYGSNLTGADFSEANLRQVRFDTARLRDADFHHSDLESADLPGADLRNARLTGADLTNADLSDADLRGADLSGATLDGANLEKIRWAGVTCPDGTRVDVPEAKSTQPPCRARP